MEHKKVNLPISSVIRRYKTNKLDLNPDYQRNAVWTTSQKQLLIDSILSGIPVPSLYWNEVSDNKMEVVDGQQRIRAMADFQDGFFKLNPDSDFGPKSFEDLSENQKDSFSEYQLSVIQLKGCAPDEIEDMFLRLQDGAPLNAAEKRRAISGKFRDVVRELSENNFFENRVNFNNLRYGFEDAVAKGLHLIFNGYVGGISPSKIKETYKSHPDLTITDIRPASLKKAYIFLDKGFKELNNLNPKLKKWASITLPLVIRDFNSNYILQNLQGKFAESYLKLKEIRVKESEKPEEDQDPKIISFNDAARADDPARLKLRHDFLKEWFLNDKNLKMLEAKEIDGQRLFTQEQKVILYKRSEGKCQKCNIEISQDNFDADHIIRHADGGKTTLSNGRALCISCNRGRRQN